MATSAEGLPAQRDGSTFAYAVLLTLAATDAAGYSIIAPVAPSIAQHTGAGPGVVGMLVATFPLGIMGGFFLATAGIKRDRTKLVLLVSLGILAIGSLGFIFGTSLSTYFLARSVMGLGSGGVWMGVTFNTLERWPGQEYLCMSRIFAAYSVGGLVGPALGALGGIARPFTAYAILVLICVGLVGVMGNSHRTRPFRADRSALRLPGFWLASAGVLFAYLALGIVEGVLPIHLGSKIGQTGIGLVYAVMSLVVAGGAALAARYAPRRALSAALALIVLGIGAAGATNLVPLWVAALAIVGAGIGLATTGSVGILLEGVPTKRIVTAMVVWSQVGIIGYFLGPLAGGGVAEVMGFRAIGMVPLLAAIPVAFLAARSSSGRT